MYNKQTAFALLKARMDRAGVSTPAPLESYWMQRLEAAAKELEKKGVRLEDTVDDNMLVADYAAYKIKNRDNEAGLPRWLSLAIRERWLTERRDGDGS